MVLFQIWNATSNKYKLQMISQADFSKNKKQMLLKSPLQKKSNKIQWHGVLLCQSTVLKKVDLWKEASNLHARGPRLTSFNAMNSSATPPTLTSNNKRGPSLPAHSLNYGQAVLICRVFLHNWMTSGCASTTIRAAEWTTYFSWSMSV